MARPSRACSQACWSPRAQGQVLGRAWTGQGSWVLATPCSRDPQMPWDRSAQSLFSFCLLLLLLLRSKPVDSARGLFPRSGALLFSRGRTHNPRVLSPSYPAGTSSSSPGSVRPRGGRRERPGALQDDGTLSLTRVQSRAQGPQGYSGPAACY